MRQLFISRFIIILFIPVILGAENINYLFRPNGANFFVYGSGKSRFLIHQSRLTRWDINKTLAKLSSAKRIVNAADDPSGLAVAEKMAALLQQLRQESLNAENMKNFYRYVESVIAQDQQLLKRMRLLVLKSANGILSREDRSYNQTEINQLIAQINMNARFSQFNTRPVIPQLTAKNLGIDKVNVVSNLYRSMKHLDAAAAKLRKLRTLQGIKENVLTFQIRGKSYYYLNLQGAESKIRDQDMAEGISTLMKQNTILKTQYGILMKAKK